MFVVNGYLSGIYFVLLGLQNFLFCASFYFIIILQIQTFNSMKLLLVQLLYQRQCVVIFAFKLNVASDNLSFPYALIISSRMLPLLLRIVERELMGRVFQSYYLSPKIMSYLLALNEGSTIVIIRLEINDNYMYISINYSMIFPELN